MNNCIEKDVCPVPKGSGTMETQNVAVTNPLPCIVIILHGVNDIGEAFPNLDQGICAGLNQRLGRSDLKPNTWDVTCIGADSFSPRQSIIKEGYSPVIPFFWGYRPVDKEAYKQDQQDYYDRLEKQLQQDPELPYDSYWRDRDIEVISDKIETKKLNCDKFGNWIDSHYQRNGGPFSDATSCIPDMYGPGMAGETAEIGKLGSEDGAKVYDNPHRIYLAYAAHRLARLIKQIRKDTEGQDIPINIIAHSQGTIITMLANLILDQDGDLPADCTILAHSPYAFEISFLEKLSKDFALGMQTKLGREQTFVNFVEKIYAGQKKRNIKFTSEFLQENGVIGSVTQGEKYTTEEGTERVYDRLGKDKTLFDRDNFGKVYNYFSPNDHVVSLRSVQGMGWQGIPDDILARCNQYGLKQRIFSQHYIVGNDTTKHALAIPLVTYQIAAKDYPVGISQQDYRQREQAGKPYGDDAIALVPLTAEQLDLLTTLPLFKQREGQLVSGFYQYGSGATVFVQYRPSEAEFVRDNPLASYNKVTDKELDDACLSAEQLRLKDDKLIQERQQVLDKYAQSPYGGMTALEAAALQNCRAEATAGVSTVGYRVTRTVTGERVPEPFIYQVDQPSAKSPLSRTIHYNDAYNSGAIDKLKQELIPDTVSKPDWLIVPSKRSISEAKYPFIQITDEAQLQRLAQENGWDRGISSVTTSYQPNYSPKKDLNVRRYLTKAELKEKITKLVEDTKDESSHHSGITMNQFAPKQVMAYDLAIGLVKGITPKNLTLLQQWRNYADWRSPANTDTEAVEYMTTGILPTELKESMGYPKKHMPKTVVNDFISVNFSQTGIEMKSQELDKKKYRLLTAWPKVQFPLPEPDLKTE